MPRLNCQISEKLDAVISRAQIVEKLKKTPTLELFLDLAVNDDGEYDGNFPYCKGRKTSATIPDFPEDKYDATEDYRVRWTLTTQTEFFLFALQHGATLWENKNPPKEP